MKKGTNVSWSLSEGGGTGKGVTVSDEDDGYILVAVHSQTGYGATVENEMHYVIFCSVTWLTII